MLGFEVDAINSVQFSNHTGYPHIKGQVLSDKELSKFNEKESIQDIRFMCFFTEEVFDGLKQNSLLSLYTHLLTGYIGKDTFLREVGSIVKDLKKANPNLIYGKFVLYSHIRVF